MSSNAQASEIYSQVHYKSAVYNYRFAGIVYGAYIVVYVTSVYVLLSPPRFTSLPTRKYMLGVTTLMFALGIIALVLGITVEFQLGNSPIVYETRLGPSGPVISYHLWEAVACLMYILCDIICAWRTVVLWKYDRRIIGILAFFILVTTGASVLSICFGLSEGRGGRSTFGGGLSKIDLESIVVVPTLCTNLLSTGLIAWKAWQRRIRVREHLCEGKGSLRFHRVYSLLIESGLIYCCIWILYWMALAGPLPDPGFNVVVFISGIYPTLIIILISKQMSSVDALGPRKDGGEPRLPICRDSTSGSDTQISSTYSI